MPTWGGAQTPRTSLLLSIRNDLGYHPDTEGTYGYYLNPVI